MSQRVLFITYHNVLPMNDCNIFLMGDTVIFFFFIYVNINFVEGLREAVDRTTISWTAQT